MAFPKNEINNFVLGSEDGNVYSGEWILKYYNESECHGVIMILQVKWNKNVTHDEKWSQMARQFNDIIRLLLIGLSFSRD